MRPNRTLIIGDIHGNYEALSKVLDKANFDITNDRIICIGDYVDGWNKSFDVVRTLLEIKNNSKFENIFLLGNHDKWFMEILENDFVNLRDENFIKSKYVNWYTQGGKKTLHSYLKNDDIFIKIHLNNFFKQLKKYHLEENKLFVHAGFNHEFGFRFSINNSPDDLIWNRSLYKEALNKYLVNENLKGKNKQIKEFKFDVFEKIYLGHTPTSLDGIEKPIIMGNVINIDQGCKKNGRLTIWIDETNEYYQVQTFK